MARTAAAFPDTGLTTNFHKLSVYAIAFSVLARHQGVTSTATFEMTLILTLLLRVVFKHAPCLYPLFNIEVDDFLPMERHAERGFCDQRTFSCELPDSRQP